MVSVSLLPSIILGTHCHRPLSRVCNNLTSSWHPAGNAPRFPLLHTQYLPAVHTSHGAAGRSDQRGFAWLECSILSGSDKANRRGELCARSSIRGELVAIHIKGNCDVHWSESSTSSRSTGERLSRYPRHAVLSLARERFEVNYSTMTISSAYIGRIHHIVIAMSMRS